MNNEMILDVILSSLLLFFHLSSFIFCLIWRKKYFYKCLHQSTAGFAFFFISTFIGIVFPILGFTFLDNGSSGTKCLIFAIVLCPFILLFSVYCLCFCIYIKGNHVIKRVLFFEEKINLKDPETIVEHRIESLWIIISSKDKVTIRIFEKGIEGEPQSFVEKCKKIQASKEK